VEATARRDLDLRPRGEAAAQREIDLRPRREEVSKAVRPTRQRGRLLEVPTPTPPPSSDGLRSSRRRRTWPYGGGSGRTRIDGSGSAHALVCPPPFISGSCASSLIYFSLKQTRRQLKSSSAVADDLDGELELQSDLGVKHARGHARRRPWTSVAGGSSDPRWWLRSRGTDGRGGELADGTGDLIGSSGWR
jgi:hypothetical protein